MNAMGRKATKRFKDFVVPPSIGTVVFTNGLLFHQSLMLRRGETVSPTSAMASHNPSSGNPVLWEPSPRNLAFQKTNLGHQATILDNQKTIQGHQASILENQKTILRNQANIEKNQGALQEI